MARSRLFRATPMCHESSTTRTRTPERSAASSGSWSFDETIGIHLDSHPGAFRRRHILGNNLALPPRACNAGNSASAVSSVELKIRGPAGRALAELTGTRASLGLVGGKVL